MAMIAKTRVISPTMPASRAVPMRPRNVAARAGLGDAMNFVGQAFVRIFSPPQDNGVNWEGTTSPFKGDIRRHGPGRPFRDGYAAPQQGGAKGASVSEEQGQGNDAMDYMSGAVGRVMGHNFTGDKATEPEWDQMAGQGWKGDIHTRDRKDFHTKSY